MNKTSPSRRTAFSATDFGSNLSVTSVLIVDDEPGMRNFLSKILAPYCKRVSQAASVDAAAKLLDENHFDVVIIDNIMPHQNGLDWLKEQRKLGFFADAILITAFADLDTAIQALRVGVADFVLKPFRSNQILNAIARCVDRQELRRENYLLKHELAVENMFVRGRLIGRSEEISDIRDTLARLAPVQTSVLFTGASGTGKEVAARTLHSLSPNSDKPFVPVNCAAISAEALANELFGQITHNADGQAVHQDGLLFHARGGTLFLDEIAELPMAVQGALLRVIEEMRIRPIGSMREVPLNLRFMFATNVDLQKRVDAGTFRADLYHRINVIQVEMPSLIKRKGDIFELSEMFIKILSDSLGMTPLPLTEGVLLKLCCYDWPGNVRELRNLIERALIDGEFPPEFNDAAQSEVGLPDSLEAVERRHILTILKECNGNRAEAARRLGVSRKTIDRKCAMWEI
ncbi:MAG: sigma-54-dependent Fis family transcriptional regulator [Amylibacter sp.]|nr:sigma-54-dependent Fis family transcriptional regulator [Amylibacter sp.]